MEEGGRPGVAIQGPSTLSVQEGQTVELVCSADGKLINPLLDRLFLDHDIISNFRQH